MKALILAAGEGTRLRPLTDRSPKCLVRLKGRPLLEYQLEVFSACGIRDIVVVGGHARGALEAYPVRVHMNPRYRETNMVYSFFCAESEFNDDLIVAYGDIIFEKRVLNAVIRAPGDLAVAVDTGWRDLWEYRMADPLSDAETLRVDSDGNLIELGRKPRNIKDIQGQYMGLLKIAKAALGDVSRFYRSLDGGGDYDGRDKDNMFMTSFVQRLIDRPMAVRAVFVDHGWLEVDTQEDLARYEKLPRKNGTLFRFDAFRD